MPYRRKSKSKSKLIVKRRRYYRKRRNLAYKISPVPLRFFTKLVYAESQIQVGVGIGAANAHVFSANGLYDPNITGTGHQPLGFDQLMSMYNHYTVIASKIYCTFSNETDTGNYECGISVLDDSTVLTTPSRYKELMKTVWKAGTNDAQGGHIRSLVNKVSVPKFLGLPSKGFLGDDTIQGSAVVNPQEQVFYHLWIQPIEATTDLSYVDLSVRVEYIVVFHGPAQITQS